MASRGFQGKIKGSDGTDWQHRERVADHYRLSVRYKGSFQLYSSIYLLIFFCVLVLEYILPYMNNGQFVTDVWQNIWLSSLFPELIGKLALAKNNSALMMLFIIGILCVGIGPLIVGAHYYSFLIIQRLTGNSFAESGSLHSAVVLDSMTIVRFLYIIFAFIIHFLSVRTGAKLCGFWRTKKTK